jgi:hypothetical protein
MPLNSEVLREIDGFVRGGFEERERIIEILCEEMHEPGELDEAEVTIAVDAAFTSLEKDKATWPSMTDCDKLDRVFCTQTNGILCPVGWHIQPAHFRSCNQLEAPMTLRPGPHSRPAQSRTSR